MNTAEIAERMPHRVHEVQLDCAAGPTRPPGQRRLARGWLWRLLEADAPIRIRHIEIQRRVPAWDCC
jgi:hypothetical protein